MNIFWTKKWKEKAITTNLLIFLILLASLLFFIISAVLTSDTSVVFWALHAIFVLFPSIIFTSIFFLSSLFTRIKIKRFGTSTVLCYNGLLKKYLIINDEIYDTALCFDTLYGYLPDGRKLKAIFSILGINLKLVK